MRRLAPSARAGSDTAASDRPNHSATAGSMRPEGSGRFFVRAMKRSLWRSQ